jgi:hypothetical protein
MLNMHNVSGKSRFDCFDVCTALGPVDLRLPFAMPTIPVLVVVSHTAKEFFVNLTQNIINSVLVKFNSPKRSPNMEHPADMQLGLGKEAHMI